ncbi:cytochrome P450 306a1-like isoform X2 [Artemia franciscana]|nr:hypothetical protein QYM36_012287 [Artemia franciscana]
MGFVPTLVISDPYLIKRLFLMEAFCGRAPLYLTFGIMQGYGLICSEGQIWRDHRKFVAHVLRNLGKYKTASGRNLIEEVIINGVDDFVMDLRHNTGQPVNITPYLRHSIGNIVNELVFGVTYKMEDETWVYLQHLLDEGFKHVAVAGPLNFLPFLRHLPKFKKTMKFILEGKQKTHIHYEEILQSIDSDKHEYRNVAEAYMIELEKKRGNVGTFTKQQIYHVLADLFGAGTDTAMTTIKWILLYMTKYPDKQERIQEELDSVVGRNNDVQMGDLAKLRYLEAFTMEVQRINNILPLGVPHSCTEDRIVEGYYVKKGTMILPFLWAMNLDPNLWKDPENFRPERFLDEYNNIIKPEFFMPFQTGRRVCLGEDIGKLTISFFVAAVLQNFNVTLKDDYDLNENAEYGFTLVPRYYELIPTCR